MTDFELNEIDPEDIEDLLLKIERSFNIKFVGNELVGLSNFGELCDHITNKIHLVHLDDCTTQQAFYKLRFAITMTVQDIEVKPDTLLSEIFPRHNRLSRVRQVEKQLGFRLSFMRPRHFITTIFILLFLASIIGLFFNWKVGILGVGISIVWNSIANKFGKEIDINTIGELTEKMARESYIKSRRNPTTFNRNEIETILRDWFSNDLYLDKTKLTRKAELL